MSYEKPLLMTKQVKNRLIILREKGFRPRTILDIGAFEGYWSQDIKSVFPNCSPFMIEGDKDKDNKLQSRDFPYEIALLSDTKKLVTFHKTKSLYTTGNSIYKENSNIFSDSNLYYTKQVETTTLKDVVQRHNLTNIDMIKLDIQGSEKDAMLGGLDIIKECKILFIELSIIEYNKDAPKLEDMVTFLSNIGFRLIDIVDLHYTSSFELQQLDAIFENSRQL